MTRDAANRPLKRFSFPDGDFAADVSQGLSNSHKALSPRFFYDSIGSALFEEITQLPEYYLTRAEGTILKTHAAEILRDAPLDGMLVEFGSGSSRKTEILLDALPSMVAYLAVDVSESALYEARSRLASRYPSLDIRPVVSDFSNPIDYPLDLAERHRIGFFPGSTIGNLTPPEAVRLLVVMRNSLGHGGRLIIGVDLKKDPHRLLAAYDDAAGVTAAFNLNLLARINRELAGSFDLKAFRHHAIYNAYEGRIEMHIVSLWDQTVRVLDQQIEFRAGERIHTENSYKYTVEQFQDLARSAGWIAQRVWLDEDRLFSVHELIWP
jgi:dimethylhistidine N-methyltransferase